MKINYNIRYAARINEFVWMNRQSFSTTGRRKEMRESERVRESKRVKISILPTLVMHIKCLMGTAATCAVTSKWFSFRLTDMIWSNIVVTVWAPLSILMVRLFDLWWFYEVIWIFRMYASIHTTNEIYLTDIKQLSRHYLLFPLHECSFKVS